MPLYEYECQQCGHRFERLARNSEDNPGSCPACNEPDPKKLLSGFAVSVKGNRPQSPACESCPSVGSCPYGKD